MVVRNTCSIGVQKLAFGHNLDNTAQYTCNLGVQPDTLPNYRVIMCEARWFWFARNSKREEHPTLHVYSP